jgi:membrane fusion protein (multidrug efflux system)
MPASLRCLFPDEECLVKSLLLFLLLLAGGVVGYFYWQSGKYPVSVEEPKVETIRKGNIEEKITGSGKLELKGGLYYVVPEAPGKVVKVAEGLAVGKVVKKGMLLLQLDDTLPQAELSAAEANVMTAEASIEEAKAKQIVAKAKIATIEEELNFSRTKLASAKQKEMTGVAPAGLLKEAEAELKKNETAAKGAAAYVNEADASYQTAVANKKRAEVMVTAKKRQLEQAAMTAPVDGVILNVSGYLKEGQLIAPQVTGALLTIANNPDQWEVKAQISEQDIGKLQQKLALKPAVRFTVEAYSAERIKFNGKVIDIAALPSAPARPSMAGLDPMQLAALAGNAGSSGPANYTVTIAVDPIPEAVAKNHPLKVGFVASDLQIIVENYSDIVTVPSAALSFTPDSMSDAQQKELKKNEEEGWSAVWFWEGGKYQARYIKAGASELGRTQVKEVLQGKPEDLVNKSAVIEAPKKVEKASIFGLGDKPLRMPG